MAAILYHVFTMPPKGMSIKDLHPVLVQHSPTDTSITRDASSYGSDSELKAGTSGPDARGNNATVRQDYAPEAEPDFFIIIESFRDLKVASRKAATLEKELKTRIFVLPPSENGYYRLSYGKYSTMDEARQALAYIKVKVRPDAWIYSVKK